MAVLEQVIAERTVESLLDWQERRGHWTAGWREHSGVGRSTIYLTEPELAELIGRIEAMMTELVEERPLDDLSSRPPGSVPVEFTFVRRAPRAHLWGQLTWARSAARSGQRDLRLLLAAGLISATGDWVLRVGLTYYVYVLTGSTVASALIMLASFVPQIVLGSVAGVFVDRWDTRRTMVISNLLLAAGLLPLLAARQAGQAWIIYAVLAWEGCVQQFFTPAEQACCPRLIDDDHLVTANALNGQTSDMSRLVGSAAGGITAAAGGITALAFTDIASFLISAALIARISTARREAGTPRATASPDSRPGRRGPCAGGWPGCAPSGPAASGWRLTSGYCG